MKTCADFIADAKGKLGNPRMSDRELGERLGGYAQQTIAAAKSGKMTDPVAVKVAEVLGKSVDPGQVVWVARTERERDPVVRKHLEAWNRTVGKALASASKTVGCVVAAVTMILMPAHDAQAVGGSGEIRTHGGDEPSPVFKFSAEVLQINSLAAFRLRNQSGNASAVGPEAAASQASLRRVPQRAVYRCLA